jgi:hypothetical protein
VASHCSDTELVQVDRVSVNMDKACTSRKAARVMFLQGKQLRAAGVDSGGGYFINNFLIKNKTFFNYE